MNINLKILSAFDALDKKLKALSDRFDGLSKEAGPKGDKGSKGDKGEKGPKGDKGADGLGRHGIKYGPDKEQQE